MTYLRRVAVLGVTLCGLLPLTVYGQELMPVPPSSAPETPVSEAMPGMQPNMMPLSPTPPQGMPPQGAPPAQQAAPAYTQQQIDQLLAPVALYPDPLIGQVLMASTYPLEVVEAERWLENPQNAALKGDQLAAAMAQEPWDPSVKSLVAFPQVLKMMNGNLQWTEQLGDAFLAQQPAVTESIQHLRQMAQSSGNLASTPQQTVTAQEGAIMIEPPTPQTVYVPYYNPMVVYGAWPWAGYPPYYFPPPPGYVYYDTGLIGFGFGIVIADWFWGWDRWDWAHHRIDIDGRRWAALDRGHAPPGGGVWEHDVAHRHGVPYHSTAAAARFGGAAAAARSSYRGYFNQSANRGATTGATAATVRSSATGSTNTRSTGTFNRQSQSSSMQPRTGTSGGSFARTQGQQRSAPVFESFSRGAEVQTQSARGATSRASMPSAAPARSAPAGGGNRGGGGGQRGNEGRNR